MICLARDLRVSPGARPFGIGRASGSWFLLPNAMSPFRGVPHQSEDPSVDTSKSPITLFDLGPVRPPGVDFRVPTQAGWQLLTQQLDTGADLSGTAVPDSSNSIIPVGACHQGGMSRVSS